VVLDGRAYALLVFLMAASVSLSSEAGAVVVSGAATTAASLSTSVVMGGSVREWFGIPSDEALYGPCLEAGGRIRLRGPRGLKLEPASARATDEGISYFVRAGSGGAPDSIGLLTWRDVRGVDVWRNEARMASLTTACSVAGLTIGYAVADAISGKPKSLTSFPAHFALLSLEALPFGVLGFVIGRRLDPVEPGRWVNCEDAHLSGR
jgi:hypothetical protein